MKINAAVLCEFAQVRDNMLFMLSGAVTRFGMKTFPSGVNAFVALVLEISEAEAREPFEVRVTVEDTDGNVTMTGVMGVQAFADRLLEPGETLQLPIAQSLRPAQLPAPGRYCVRVAIPEYDLETVLGFSALVSK